MHAPMQRPGKLWDLRITVTWYSHRGKTWNSSGAAKLKSQIGYALSHPPVQPLQHCWLGLPCWFHFKRPIPACNHFWCCIAWRATGSFEELPLPVSEGTFQHLSKKANLHYSTISHSFGKPSGSITFKTLQRPSLWNLWKWNPDRLAFKHP